MIDHAGSDQQQPSVFILQLKSCLTINSQCLSKSADIRSIFQWTEVHFILPTDKQRTRFQIIKSVHSNNGCPLLFVFPPDPAPLYIDILSWQNRLQAKLPLPLSGAEISGTTDTFKASTLQWENSLYSTTEFF